MLRPTDSWVCLVHEHSAGLKTLNPNPRLFTLCRKPGFHQNFRHPDARIMALFRQRMLDCANVATHHRQVLLCQCAGSLKPSKRTVIQ